MKVFLNEKLKNLKEIQTYLLKVGLSLFFYSVIIVVFYYIIFTFLNISKIKQETTYNLIKTNSKVETFYQKILPQVVYHNGEIFLFDKKGNIVYKLHNKNFNTGFKFKNFYFSFFNFNFLIGFKIKGYYFYLDFFKNIYIFLKVFSFIIYLLFFGSFLVLLEIIQNENKKTLLKLANAEALATNNSMVLLTENIHHELNTPLEVLENKYKKIEKEISKYFQKQCQNSQNLSLPQLKKCLKKEEDKKFLQTIIDSDFFIETSISQIGGILENMRDFKKLRFSNGNKTIFELVDGSVKILKATFNSDFLVTIDEELKKYKINHETKMKNSDFINVFINHLKNSLEAESTLIEIKFFKFEKNSLEILIKDDGNGIPKKLIPWIYSMNKSSKNGKDTIGLRGNGMFLNKHLLKAFGGDESLFYTEKNKGTTFLVKIPALKKQD